MKLVLLLLVMAALPAALGCGQRDTDDNPGPAGTVPPAVPPKPSLPASEPVEQVQEPQTESLLQAASSGNISDVQIYVRRDPASVQRPAENGMLPIHLAAMHGRGEVIRILLEAGADVDTPQAQTGGKPLQYAAAEGHLEAARILLDAGADVDSTDNLGRTPLMWAASQGHEPVIEELLERGADVNRQTGTGWTARRYAEQEGHVRVAEFLRSRQ